MDKENRRDCKLDPKPVKFLNSNSLQFIDYMFYRLPFPDLAALKKMQETIKLTADVVTFLNKMHEDLLDPRATSDLRKGWKEFLKTEGKQRGPSNPGRSSWSSRRERNRTPTKEELAALVCLLSFVHQHCEVHMRMSCSLQAAAARRSASPAARSASPAASSASQAGSSASLAAHSLSLGARKAASEYGNTHSSDSRGPTPK